MPHRGASAAPSVQTTVVELPNARLTMHGMGHLTVLTCEGVYSARLLQDLEQYARRTAESLGLDLSGLKGIKPGVVPFLERIRVLLGRRGHRLVLLDPPAQLRDILALQGQADKYLSDPGGAPLNAADTAAREVRNFTLALRETQHFERGIENAEERISAFMPQWLPVFPGWRFAAYWRPCDRIGGDFYDFIPLSDTTLGIALGDVSGHGLSAAIIMGIAKKVLRLRALDMTEAPPGEVLMQVNRDLRADLGKGTFVTIFYGVLDARNDAFTFVRAGHEPPLLLAGDGGRPEVLMSSGTPVGIVDDRTFGRITEQCAISLATASGVVMVSDGVTEAASARGVRFGRERLREALAGVPAHAALRVVLEHLAAFSGSGSQSDDMTMIACARLNDPVPPPPA